LKTATEIFQQLSPVVFPEDQQEQDLVGPNQVERTMWSFLVTDLFEEAQVSGVAMDLFHALVGRGEVLHSNEQRAPLSATMSSLQ
jgi:hypothetical protein